MGFLSSVHATHPAPSPCSPLYSTRCPQSSATIPDLPFHTTTAIHSHSTPIMPGGCQRGLVEMG